MKITFLGTGTSQGIPVIGCSCEVCSSKNPKDKRLRVSVMIETDRQNFLIDIGPDFRYQMLRENSKDIDAILLTHEHNDHVAGLDDVRPYNFKYNKDMPVYGLERVLRHIRSRYDYIFEASKYPGLPQVRLHTIQASVPFFVDTQMVTPIPVLHGRLPIVGYRLGDFTYLTDVKYIEESALDLIKGSKVVVLSALRHQDHHSHLTLEEAIQWAKKINAPKTYLTHFSHLLGTAEDTQKLLPDNTIALAYDGLKINL